MKFKKTASVLLAAAMLVPQTCIVSYAAEKNADMTTALTYVKQRIDIPENLTAFTHSSRLVAGKNSYSFNWHTETDGDYEEINVNIIGKVITYFDNGKTVYGTDYKFAKLESDELYKKAKEAVKMLNPTVCNNIEISETPSISLSANYARFNIKRVKDGIPVAGSTGHLYLNKDTGELLEYNLNWIVGAGFADPADAVSVETAQKSFEREFPVELVYTTEYDWETGKMTPHLIYRQTKTGEIDALTGKLSTYEESYLEYEETVAEEDDCDEGGDEDINPDTAGVNFTESEIEKLELEEKLIKADEAIKIIQDMGIFNISDNAESTYSSCDYDDFLGVYVRNVSFQSDVTGYVAIDEPDVEEVVEEVEDVADGDDSDSTPAYDPKAKQVTYRVYGNIQINAETGELLRYICSNSSNMNATKLKTEKGTDRILAARFKKIAGEVAEEFPTDKANVTYHREYISKERRDNGEIGELRGGTARINRYANGIKCMDETASITIDRNGKVSSYDITYYGIEYPEPKNIITEEDAYTSFFDQVDFSLRFRCALKDNKDVVTALVYTAARMLYIDAFTGKLTASTGSEVYYEAETGEYTDLNGSRYGKIAKKLAAYGITVMDEDGSLNEDKVITREEFRNLVRNIGCYARVEEEEKGKPLTRQYAAKIFAYGRISETIAEMPIFKSSFSDVKETSKYVGYIEVVTNLGYMSGKGGKFSPAKKVTRGQALKMIYDILAK